MTPCEFFWRGGYIKNLCLYHFFHSLRETKQHVTGQLPRRPLVVMQNKPLGNETMDHMRRGTQSHIPSASEIREITTMVPLEIGLIVYPHVTQFLSIKFLWVFDSFWITLDPKCSQWLYLGYTWRFLKINFLCSVSTYCLRSPPGKRISCGKPSTAAASETLERHKHPEIKYQQIKSDDT